MTETTPPSGDPALPPGPTVGNYAKAINATIILTLGALGQAQADGRISSLEWWMILLALLGGVANIGLPLKNRLAGGYAKVILTGLIAAVTQIVSATDGHNFTSAEITFLLVTFFTSIGSVYASPNAALSDAFRTDGLSSPSTGYNRF